MCDNKVKYYVVSEASDNHILYVHYPKTEPDTPYLTFKHKDNAELVANAFNADVRDMSYLRFFCGNVINSLKGKV